MRGEVGDEERTHEAEAAAVGENEEFLLSSVKNDESSEFSI
jgi:hypothetical protein